MNESITFLRTIVKEELNRFKNKETPYYDYGGIKYEYTTSVGWRGWVGDFLMVEYSYTLERGTSGWQINRPDKESLFLLDESASPLQDDVKDIAKKIASFIAQHEKNKHDFYKLFPNL